MKNKANTKSSELLSLDKMPIQGIICLFNATKSEYEYLQKARTGIHTRVGIFITLLTALVSATFTKGMPGIIESFRKNLITAHFRVIFLTVLLVCFSIALISYIRIFFVRNYYAFEYYKYTGFSINQIVDFQDAQLIMHMYKEYSRCIDFNQKQFEKSVSYYNFANKWLIATIVFTIATIIINIL